MKKIVILFVLLICGCIIFHFFTQVRNNIDIFHSLDNVTSPVTPYKVNQNYIVAQNIRTRIVDTIFFKEKTVLNFWATWCKPCLVEMPFLKGISTKQKVILLSNDSIQLQLAILSKMNINIQAYYYTDTSMFSANQLLPRTVLFKNDTAIKDFYGNIEYYKDSIEVWYKE